jgi:hypothetical protein
MQIGLDGIEAGILQLIGAELFHESDSPPFLVFIKQNACSLFSDAMQSKMKLIMAIATKGMKDISRGALRVDADEGRPGVNVSEHEG